MRYRAVLADGLIWVVVGNGDVAPPGLVFMLAMFGSLLCCCHSSAALAADEIWVQKKCAVSDAPVAWVLIVCLMIFLVLFSENLVGTRRLGRKRRTKNEQLTTYRFLSLFHSFVFSDADCMCKGECRMRDCKNSGVYQMIKSDVMWHNIHKCEMVCTDSTERSLWSAWGLHQPF